MSEEPQEKKGGGSLVLVLIFVGVIAVLGKMLFGEVFKSDSPERSNSEAVAKPVDEGPPQPPPPAPARVDPEPAPAPPPVVSAPPPPPAPPAVDIDKLAKAEVRQNQEAVYELIEPKLNQIKASPDRASAQQIYLGLEAEARSTGAKSATNMATKLRVQGATEGQVSIAEREVNTFTDGWLRAARDEVAKRPGPPVVAEPPAPAPAGAGMIDVVTGDSRKEVHRYKAGAQRGTLLKAEIEKQSSLWPLLVRAYDQQPRNEDSFIWKYLCTQLEQQGARDEFKKKDLIESKRAELKLRVEEAKKITRIRVRLKVSFRQYDFENSRIQLDHAYLGFAYPRGASSLSSYLAINRLEGGRQRQLLPSYLRLDEATARAVAAESPDRQLWVDVEGNITGLYGSRILVNATSAEVSTPSGSRKWTLPVN